VIRVDAAWLAVHPLDMGAGLDTALARAVNVFGEVICSGLSTTTALADSPSVSGAGLRNIAPNVGTHYYRRVS